MRARAAVVALIGFITFIVGGHEDAANTSYATSKITKICGVPFFEDIPVADFPIGKDRESPIGKAVHVYRRENMIHYLNGGPISVNWQCFFSAAGNVKLIGGQPIWNQRPIYQRGRYVNPHIIGGRLRVVLEGNIEHRFIADSNLSSWVNYNVIGTCRDASPSNDGYIRAQLTPCCAPSQFKLNAADYYQWNSYKEKERSKSSDDHVRDVDIAYKFLMQPFVWFAIGLACTITGYLMQAVAAQQVEKRWLSRALIVSGIFLASAGPLVFLWGWLVRGWGLLL